MKMRLAGVLTLLLFLGAPAHAANSFVMPQITTGPHARVSAELNYSALQAGQQAVIAVVIDIQPGLHSQPYKPGDPNATAVQIVANNAIRNFQPIYPSAKEHIDPKLGKLYVYDGRTIVYVPLEVSAAAVSGSVTINGLVTAQVCTDKTNVCFLTEQFPFQLNTTVVGSGTPVTPNKPELFKEFDPTVFSHPVLPQEASASDGSSFKILGLTVGADSYSLAFLAAILVGIIFNVMPCVLPVLPLKAIGFYEVSQHNRLKSFSFGIVFSLGIISTFAILARLIFILHIQWGELFSHWWFIWTVCIVLIVMAFASFGAFTISLPVRLYAFEPRHDTYFGNFLFGILTAVLSTPCTAPFFPPLLVWAATKSTFIGTSLLMTVGLGMALPYLILSATPELARKIPRTGPWSELIKQIMGFLLLPVAAYLLIGRYWPEVGLSWILLGSALIGGIFMVVKTHTLMPRRGPLMISTTIAIVAIAAGILAVVFAPAELPFRPFTTEALAEARGKSRIVMVDFTAQWCLNCKFIENHVFPDPQVLKAISDHRVVLLKADLTQKDAAGWPLLKKLNSSGGIPLTAVYGPSRDEPIQLTSIYSTDDLLKALTKAGEK